MLICSCYIFHSLSQQMYVTEHLEIKYTNHFLVISTRLELVLLTCFTFYSWRFGLASPNFAQVGWTLDWPGTGWMRGSQFHPSPFVATWPLFIFLSFCAIWLLVSWLLQMYCSCCFNLRNISLAQLLANREDLGFICLYLLVSLCFSRAWCLLGLEL